MKNQIMTAVLSVGFLATTFSSVAGFAKPTSADHMKVYTDTAREIRSLHRQIGIGAIVKSTQSELTSFAKEVVVERGGSSYASASGYATEGESWQQGSWRRGRDSSYSFGAYSSGYAQAGSYDWDVTDVLLMNPREVAEFPDHVERNWNQLRGQLLSYLDKSERSLVRMKELGVRNLAAAYELAKVKRPVNQNGLNETIAILGDLNFLGDHQVTRCWRFQSADRSRSSSHASASAASGSSGYETRRYEDSSSWSSGYSRASSSYWQQIGTDQTTCYASTQTIEVKANESVARINLTELDELLKRWVDALETLKLAAPAQTEFLTWDSPYYQ